MSAVDDVQDQLIAHQIELQRYAAGLRTRMLTELNKSDRAVVDELRTQFESFDELAPQRRAQQLKQMERQLTAVTDARDVGWQAAKNVLLAEVSKLAEVEADFTYSALRGVLPGAISVHFVSGDQVAAAAESRPFQGRLLSDWADGLATADRKRIRDAITQGLVEGQSVDELVRRLRGTSAAQSKDGLLEIGRRDVDTVVRTAVNHLSSVARDEVFAGNPHIIVGMKWVSTLDGRTSSICRSRDGCITPIVPAQTSEVLKTSEVSRSARRGGLPKGYPPLVPSTARPPAHFNCRSMLVPVFDLESIGQQLGDQIIVRDAQTQQPTTIDFRAQAQAKYQTGNNNAWSSLSDGQQSRLIKAQRDAWLRANIGSVPSDTTFEAWLNRQPADVQTKLLTPAQTKQVQSEAKLEKYVDQSGKELTLKQLVSTLAPLPPDAIGREPSPISNFSATTSAEFQAEVRKALDRLPDKVKRTLNAAKTQIKTGVLLTDAIPSLTGEPPGWPPGSEWDEVGGVHRRENQISVIGVSEFVKQDTALSKNKRIGGAVRHEVGHAWDFAAGTANPISQSAEFVKAYQEDILRVGPKDRSAFRYFLRAGPIGRLETFAEAFAILNGGGTSTIQGRDIQFRQAFSNTLRVVAKSLADGPQP